MRLGLVTRYAHHEATYAALRLAEWAGLNDYQPSLFSATRKKIRVDPNWDHRVVRGQSYAEWAEHQDWIIWTHAPSMQQFEWTAQHRHTAILCLWQELEGGHREVYRQADVVIAPSRDVARFLQSSWRLPNVVAVPWDTGLPIVTKPDRRRDNVRLLLPLFDAPRRTEATALDVAGRLLYRYPNTTLTVCYNSSVLASFAKSRIRQFIQYFQGRVTTERAVVPRDRPLVYQRHDLTLWPAHAENIGLVGLTSVTMGTPVVAFAMPPIVEFLNERNANLASSVALGNNLGVPQIRPEYANLESRACEILDVPDRLQELQHGTSYGLVQRRAVFGAVLSRILV